LKLSKPYSKKLAVQKVIHYSTVYWQIKRVTAQQALNSQTQRAFEALDAFTKNRPGEDAGQLATELQASLYQGLFFRTELYKLLQLSINLAPALPGPLSEISPATAATFNHLLYQLAQFGRVAQEMAVSLHANGIATKAEKSGVFANIKARADILVLDMILQGNAVRARLCNLIVKHGSNSEALQSGLQSLVAQSPEHARLITKTPQIYFNG